MKKALLLILFFLLTSPLAALDIDITGEFRTRAVNFQNKDLTSNNAIMIFDTRLRMWIIPKPTKNLSLYLGFEIGDISWGDSIGNFADDNNLGKSSGGALGTDGVNIETKHIYVDYDFKQGFSFQVGFLPFSDPSQFVIDSDIPGIVLKYKFGNFTIKGVYARSYSGPDGIDGDADQVAYASKDSDTIDLSDDRNDYFISLEYKKSKKSKITGWILFDDNNKYKDKTPATKQITSQLFFAGLRVEKEFSKQFKIEGNAILNTGKITELAPDNGSEMVLAYAANIKTTIDLDNFEIGIQARITSGNASSDTNIGDNVKQFHTLDGNGGDNGSWLSLLFGGGIFNHQSYFHHKTTTGRLVNASSGYFVRNDPGITSFETRISRNLIPKKIRLRIAAGCAFTTKKVLTASDEEVSFLGVETDLSLRFTIAKNFNFYIGGGYLISGKALAPTLALDNSIVDDPRNFGNGNSFKIESAIKLKF